ncbi:TetR/AcrR family transcriptional regulator [Aliarcobacter butzleri]|uniref:TetR/AcrR family transcriptional regulator n=1 Tax=Aliarcobacter butzleri TaxID=28197 RepID=UPI0021B66C9C|nr:TetR/AcrR family transcriptional regulator [Aliarcobacter butzleri]MCT7587858.1 TetR/AcrR family transcriptional regulator [Aliarcobacter butzleri]
MSEIREKLIKNAIDTIQKSGIHKLTMRELGNAVNIKSSSVMYHFKSKDELMTELVKVYNQQFFNYLEEINQKTTNPLERINQLIDLYEASLKDEKLCLCGMIASESDNLNETTKALVVEFFNHIEKWIEENIILLNNDKNLSKVILSSLNGAMLIDNINEHKINYLNAIRSMIKNFSR